MMNPTQRTSEALRRLLKAEMRLHVYRLKAKDDPDTWSPMLTLEQGFLEGAKKEWEEVPSLWGEGSEPILTDILEKGVAEAKAHTIDLLGSRIPSVASILDSMQFSLKTYLGVM